MSNMIKCSCGAVDIMTPKKGESPEEYIARKRCSHCYKRGLARRLTEDEKNWR